MGPESPSGSCSSDSSRSGDGRRVRSVFITKRTMVTNAAADRVIGTNDELMLRECAARLQHGDQLGEVQVTLRDGTEATVGAEPVLDGLSPVGVLLRLSPLTNGYRPG